METKPFVSEFYKDGDNYYKLNGKRYWIISNYDFSLSITRTNITTDFLDRLEERKRITEKEFEKVKDEVLLKLLRLK